MTHYAINFALVDEHQRTVGAEAVVCDMGGEVEAHHFVGFYDVDSEEKGV